MYIILFLSLFWKKKLPSNKSSNIDAGETVREREGEKWNEKKAKERKMLYETRI